MTTCEHYWKMGRTTYDWELRLAITEAKCYRCGSERTFSSQLTEAYEWSIRGTEK